MIFTPMHINPYWIFPLASAIISAIVTFKVYFANPKNIHNKLFTIFLIGLFSYSTCELLANLHFSTMQSLFLAKMCFLCIVVSLLIFLHFSFIFPKAKPLNIKVKTFLILAYISGLIVFIIFYFNVTIHDLVKIESGIFLYYSSQSSFMSFYLMIIIVFIFYNIIQSYRKTIDDLEKKQLSYVLFALVMTVIISMTHNILLLLKLQTIPFGSIAFSIVSVFIGASILKFDFFEYKPMAEVLLSNEKISQLNRVELEKEVNARTSELVNINKKLKSEIYHRTKAQETIEQSIKEKEILLKELHHRVKNNLQIVSSLIYLQMRKEDDVEISNLLDDINNRIRSMSLIHENIYKSDTFDKIYLKDYVQSMVNELSIIYDVDLTNVQVLLEIDEIDLDIDKSILCGLIINEILMNSLKHAFPNNKKGIISITIEKHKKEYKINIKDNGIGLPIDFSIQKTKTLGIQLINNIVKQLNGTIQVRLKNPTEFIITCPI